MPDNTGLRDLLIFMTVNDEPSMYRTNALENYLNKLSQEAGFSDWIDAYHNL
jgi:hypothetical protein